MSAFGVAIWNLLCELAPWLLLGMVLSGLLHWAVPPAMVRARFRGWTGVLRAVLLGVPLPLCSCGVIPAGVGLRRNGASRGATTAFLISTPQTGVDSLLVTVAMFGWPFAILKVVLAIVTGVAGGWLVEWLAPEPAADAEGATNAAACRTELPPRPTLAQAASHALEILRSIWLWLLAGVALSAVLPWLMPAAAIHSLVDLGLFPTLFAVLLFSMPLYVCATASVPLAAGLVSTGLPMAAGFVFLFSGPATNLATMGAVAGQLGRRVFAVYLAVLIAGGLLGAWLVSAAGWVLPASVTHVHEHRAWWQIASALLLIALFAWLALERLQAAWFRLSSGKTEPAGPRIELAVTGMHCQNCVDKLRRAIRTIPGARAIDVDLARHRVAVSGDVSRDLLLAAIRSCGFQPETGPDQAGVPAGPPSDDSGPPVHKAPGSLVALQGPSASAPNPASPGSRPPESTQP